MVKRSLPVREYQQEHRGSTIHHQLTLYLFFISFPSLLLKDLLGKEGKGNKDREVADGGSPVLLLVLDKESYLSPSQVQSFGGFHVHTVSKRSPAIGVYISFIFV